MRDRHIAIRQSLVDDMEFLIKRCARLKRGEEKEVDVSTRKMTAALAHLEKAKENIFAAIIQEEH